MGRSYGAVREFFLNIRDSYNIDGHGNNWNDINANTNSMAKTNLDKIRLHRNSMLMSLKKGEIDESLYNKWEDRYYKYLNIYNSLGDSFIDRARKFFILKKLEKFDSDGHLIKSTRDIEEALEYEQEGINIIFNNIVDYGPALNKDSLKGFSQQKAANVYVITDSNNVKSATSNTGFSRESDNIYENKSVEDGTDITQVF